VRRAIESTTGGNNMKLHRGLAALACACAATSSHAVQFAVGVVDAVRTHDAVAQPQWAPPMYWITLKGVTSAGTCGKFGSEVMFVGTDYSSFAMAVKAETSALPVSVAYSDTDLVNGYCRIEYLSMGNPPPQ